MKKWFEEVNFGGGFMIVEWKIGRAAKYVPCMQIQCGSHIIISINGNILLLFKISAQTCQTSGVSTLLPHYQWTMEQE